MKKSWLTAGIAAATMCVSPAFASSTAVEGMKGAQLIEYAAQPYIQYREDIDHVSGEMPADEGAMRDTYFRLASHDNRTMAASWIAYAAMIAADQPDFAAEIARRVKKRGGREAFLEELESNPAVVRNMKGSEEAVAAIMAFATNDASRIRKVGDSFISEAYEMQKVSWAKAPISKGGTQRVEDALKYAATRRWADYGRKVKPSKNGTVRPDLVSLASWSPEWSKEDAQVNPSARPGTIVTKALVLGVRYATNTAEQEHLASFGTSKKSERCFTNAKMNLDQCIAATRTPYEEAFCLGQHALNDVSSCVGWPAGVGAAGS
ncbi:hypothetical protein [Parvularcula maris]|uniref:Sel1 repeat family protein n=1 Tax=Parvularcula maris TaxID=2965077 RepID=A0A9X2L770_9PROT|nr:hypothetical protein [Parvularcula maris]MCQ8184226.1 hypothetical protein [Parvularcula maris]